VWATESWLTKRTAPNGLTLTVLGEGPVAVIATTMTTLGAADPSETTTRAATTPTKATLANSSQLRTNVVSSLEVSPAA
jgi:hypothetical protein